MPPVLPIHRPQPGEIERHHRQLDNLLRRMRELKKIGVD